MLTEQFITSVGALTKAPGANVVKDASISIHEFQPLSQQRAIFRKSVTLPNCLAASDRHIFAAQADKGVVHVYSRERGNQEATVPFTERITSVVLTCDDSVLALGTAEGSIFLWETCTGRQITTSQAHLQAITALSADPTSNFLLSASKDSTVHVWSIPALLSFTSTSNVSPLRSFSSHRAAVTALTVGHSASHCNFAVSTSEDRTCLIWDYRTGNTLRTYLLPNVPLCIDLDPADRAVYLGYEDGSLQQLDLYASPSGNLDAVANGSNPLDPVQPSAAAKWKSPDKSHGATLCLSVSFDGSAIVSGHESGSILSWDVARGSFATAQTQLPLPGPVNNIRFLPVTGFANKQDDRRIEIIDIVKPKFGAFDTSDSGAVPGNYTLSFKFSSGSDARPCSFQDRLTSAVFPTSLLDEGLAELAAWGRVGASQTNGDSTDTNEDFMALDEALAEPGKPSLQEENVKLKAQIAALKRVQSKSLEKLERLSNEKIAFLKEEERRLAGLNGSTINGVDSENSDEDMG